MSGQTLPTQVLRVRDLRVGFITSADTPVVAVDGISFDVERGQVLALVGESGSGKSATAMTIPRFHRTKTELSGEVLVSGRNVLELSDRELRDIRRSEIGYIFQDPLDALNPRHRIARQLIEAVGRYPMRLSEADYSQAVEMLESVHINQPERVARSFPHELSGGMRQRVVIAMALARTPGLIVADEPTTALDPTVQVKILELLREKIDALGCGALLITHDMGVVSRVSDTIAVMRNGRIVEQGVTHEVLAHPQHDYTKELIAAIPRRRRSSDDAQ